MNVSLANRQTYLGRGWEEIAQYFQYRFPRYQFTPAYRKGWDGYVKFLQNGILPTGLFLTMRRMIEREEGITFKIYDERIAPKFNEKWLRKVQAGRTKLYDYQVDCLLRMVKRSRTGGIVLNATGTGKTLLAAAYFKALKGHGVFIVDERALMRQAQEEIEDFLRERVGTIGDGSKDYRRVNVATVQSLAQVRRQEFGQRIRRCGDLVLMFDELHMMLNKRSTDVAQSYAPLACFGLTATLEWEKTDVRLQAAALCGPVVFRYNYEQGRADKRLANGVVLGVDIVRDLPPREPEQNTQDYYRQCIVRSKRRNDAVEQLVREAVKRDKHVIVLVERVAHVKKLLARLDDLPVEAVFGERKTVQRLRSKAKFEAGMLRVIIANKVFKKGVNLKRCDVIIDAAGMKNRNDSQQKFGRGVRLFKSKRGLIYIDVGDLSESGFEETNSWQKATGIRRKALSDLGVKVKERVWKSGSAAAVFNAAEKLL